MYLDRERAAQLGRETVAILAAGEYRTPSGTHVDLRAALRAAQDGSRSYPPERAIALPSPGGATTRIEVANETTLASALRLVQAGHRPAALNFASARHPGGGFLNGARAQEESLARASGLYACLAGHAMYALHEALGDPMYTSYAIYSPAVPVFRHDDGTQREQPFACAFITAPAVNARVVRDRGRATADAIHAAMRERVQRVLAIAAEHGHSALVLGAWGCGVFGNDGDAIAGLFRAALDGPLRGAFDQVTFAVLDSSHDEQYIGPFRRAFYAPPVTRRRNR